MARAELDNIAALFKNISFIAQCTQRLTASAGVARFAISADATLREAELALISAKSRGRNRVERSRRWH